MNAAFDGTVLFEQLDLTVGSWERSALEKSAVGVDGVVSVDLGKRAREVVVRGLVRAFSDQRLMIRLDAVRALADGACHTLAVSDGRYFDRLRVDGVETGSRSYSGRGVCCEFTVRFRQLGE
jgi:hypothetical protein